MIVDCRVCYFYWVVSEWGVWTSLLFCWKWQQLIDVEKMNGSLALQNVQVFLPFPPVSGTSLKL